MAKTNPVKQKLEAESKQNFDQFKLFLMVSFHEGVHLIKELISRPDKKNIQMIQAVAQQLEPTEMKKIFTKLTDSEREKWKGYIEHQLNGQELFEGNKALSEEVIRNKVSPYPIKDLELVDLLLSLDVDLAKAFIETHSDQASVYLNLVAADFASRVLDSINQEKAKDYILQSLAFNFYENKDGFSSFKSVLKSFVNEHKKVPFNDLLSQILVTFNPLKERMIYKIMLQQGLKNEFKEAALKNYPSDLVEELPSEFFKKMMQEYPLPKKVELLASLEGSKRASYLARFADEGSALRDIINLELENVTSNTAVSSRISKQKERIWSEFIKYVRELVKKDETVQTEVTSIIDDWGRKLR